jgi:hypothetical protein
MDSLLIDGSFWRYDKAITVDISSLILLRAEYDSSTYLNGQKNIWDINKYSDGRKLMRVWNDSVPFIYSLPDTYSITVESYDIRGNSIINTFDGFLKVE